ncbi:MAG: cell division ATP-binding protein FtsE [Pseudomonadota bacterium]
MGDCHLTPLFAASKHYSDGPNTIRRFGEKVVSTLSANAVTPTLESVGQANRVRFENVGMRYGLGKEVLRNITFQLEPGSFHFLTGPSGAGKTSLLKLLYLAHRPSRGIIEIFGQDAANMARRRLPALRRRIGVVFQDFRLLDHLSALENVALPLRLAGGKDAQIRDHVRELLTWVGLADRMDATPPTLSGGEQQRVAIARAVIGRPDMLIADEPTGNVDPQMSRRLLHLFAELNKIGTTVVIATHETGLLERVSANILHLEDGELVPSPYQGGVA